MMDTLFCRNCVSSRISPPSGQFYLVFSLIRFIDSASVGLLSQSKWAARQNDCVVALLAGCRQSHPVYRLRKCWSAVPKYVGCSTEWLCCCFVGWLSSVSSSLSTPQMLVCCPKVRWLLDRMIVSLLCWLVACCCKQICVLGLPIIFSLSLYLCVSYLCLVVCFLVCLSVSS